MKLAQWFEENPKLFKEWDSSANSQDMLENLAYSSKEKAWWICENGHRWETGINTRLILKCGCPFCAGKRVLEGFNDLATLHPEILSKWDYDKNVDISPTELTESSHKLIWWKCDKGHSWQSRVQSVINAREGHSGCPYCSGKYAVKGENDLATLNPELLKEWCYELNDVPPDEVKAGSYKKYWWKCEKGHTWLAAPYNRTSNQKAKCPYCINYRVWTGYNDLATLAPEVAKEWCYELNGDLKPCDVSKGAHIKVWWKCEKGHTWQALVHARTRAKSTGCPYCTRSKKPKISE